ncbi:PaaI family thioesterase [Mycobacterium seoulense]|uniref:PaaI family thioesterase n=1 Tax=Mycobacterium seoulense TaxID=386911 RepID=UPI003CF39D20
MHVNTQAYGVWAQAVENLMSYRYLGCRSVLGEGYDALGRMPVRSDLRHGEGLLAAPVAIAMLDTAGIAVDRHWQLALTHIGIQLCGPVGEDVDAVAVCGTMTRRARSQIFTEARITAEDDPHRLLGLGTADWTMISPTGTGFEYIDPGPGVPDTGDLPPLASAYSARLKGDGRFVIEELTPELGGVLLHHGPIIVALEAAALHAAGRVRRVQSLDVRIVKAGRTGPFVANASVESDVAGSILVSARLHQGDDEANVVATALLRVVA